MTVTNLHSRVLPFLRYSVGDRAVLGEGPCACGVPGVTLERVSGRTGDQLKLPDGSELSPRVFAHVFKDTPNVRVWQVVPARSPQCQGEEVDAGFDEAQAGLIKGYMNRHCGPDMRVDLTTSEPIARTTSGKYRVVIRELK